jgi:hypothetical protein
VALNQHHGGHRQASSGGARGQRSKETNAAFEAHFTEISEPNTQTDTPVIVMMSAVK